MRKKLTYARVHYKTYDGKGNVVYETNNRTDKYESCFSSLREVNYTSIEMFSLDCEPTYEYKDEYLKKLKKIYPMGIKENSVEFKTTGCHKKDMFLLTLLRFLIEHNEDFDNDLFFQRYLGKDYNNKDELVNLLDVYNSDNVVGIYSNCGHLLCNANKYKAKLRTTKEFIEEKEFRNIHSFFTSDETREDHED